MKASKNEKPKNPDAPKRAMTPFLYFSNEMIFKIKAENPEMSFGDLGKNLGELFRGLSAEAKEKYETLARKDEERYKTAMSDYIAASKVNSDDDGLKEDAGDDDDDDDEERVELSNG
jgi:hypothetical protein